MGWMARAGDRGAAYARTRTRGWPRWRRRARARWMSRGRVWCDVMVTDGVYALFVVRR
jgi:hypothetical protein